MFSKQSMEMLLDLVENRISDPELYEPSGKRELANLKAALDELTALAAFGTTPPTERRRRGRPSKHAVLHS